MASPLLYNIMRIFYLFTIGALLSTALLWCGIFGILKRKTAALTAAILMACAAILLALAVHPGNTFYGDILTHKEISSKKIVLTFDDGPYPPYTQQLLEVLRTKNVKATFFMVTENAVRYPDIVKAVQNDGHEIALHANKHQDFLKLDTLQLNTDIIHGQSRLEEITGQRIRFMRPPHGFRDWHTVTAIHSAGMQIVNWSIIPRDWTNPGADVIATRVINRAKPGAIILLHDGDSPRMTASREQTVSATAMIIDALRAQGYEFITVGELVNEK